MSRYIYTLLHLTRRQLCGRICSLPTATHQCLQENTQSHLYTQGIHVRLSHLSFSRRQTRRTRTRIVGQGHAHEERVPRRSRFSTRGLVSRRCRWAQICLGRCYREPISNYDLTCTYTAQPVDIPLVSTRTKLDARGSVQIKLGFIKPDNIAMEFADIFAELVKQSRRSVVSADPVSREYYNLRFINSYVDRRSWNHPIQPGWPTIRR